MIPAVLREREFRLLWAGQTVSVIGDGILLLALSFAVLDLTGSVTDVGIVIAASRAPLVRRCSPAASWPTASRAAG